ncbi:MAG TPA: HAMP domain-containing protein [bacterium]|nr:HAMP domain-containing protein [bacterium]
MKLFSKTLLFFISLILLQWLFSVIIITNLVKKDNIAKIRIALSGEAALVYESHNSWKRNIWKKLITLKEDKAIAYEIFNFSPAKKNTLMVHLKSMFIRSGIDYIVIRDNSNNSYDIISLKISTITIADVKHISNNKTFPNLKIMSLGNDLVMVGVVKIEMVGDSSIDIFLIKKMDNEYCDYLTLNRHSQASFFMDGKYISGAIMDPVSQWLEDLTGLKTAYREIDNVEISGIYYSIAIQKLENLYNEINNTYYILQLVTFLSNQPYVERLAVIREILVYVTLSVTLFTILLSLLFSRNITNPIMVLLKAMYRVKSGNYDTSLCLIGKNEITRLYEGFNEMAAKLGKDKLVMQNYINEIIILNEYNEKIINSIHSGIIIVDRHIIIEKANRYFFEAFSLIEDDIIGKALELLSLDIIDREVINDIRLIITGERRSLSCIKRSRHKAVYEVKFYPLYSSNEHAQSVSGCIIVAEDISQKIEFEEKIFQAEKLSSLSMLSAGVAHEINNPLSSIMSNVQNLLEDEKEKNKEVPLKLIEQETRRIAQIVQELLKFSSMNAEADAEADVNAVIFQVTGLIKYAIKQEKQISITTSLEGNLPLARINENEFKQLMINLITNAIQAIDEKGQIEVKSFYSNKKGRIFVVVIDSGKGIPQEIISRIFDPFFTTKKNGEGTGLGLSIVYGIIKKYSGDIAISSKEKQGTTAQLSILPIKEMGI